MLGFITIRKHPLVHFVKSEHTQFESWTDPIILYNGNINDDTYNSHRISELEAQKEGIKSSESCTNIVWES